MIRADHPSLLFAEHIFAHQPMRLVKGLVSAYMAYPLAERLEKRNVRSKLLQLRHHYSLPLEQRMLVSKSRLADTLHHAGHKVPYYRDLFRSISFDPEKVRSDPNYLNELPYLTKDIIREQGERMLSQPLAQVRHHACKTGGSTGVSTVIYYDQPAADYSAAVTLYARERIGKKKFKAELHCACRFPDAVVAQWPSREDFKCFAMNRSNVFFDRVDESGLQEMWSTMKRRRPYLVHEHPSTIYALACYVERKYGGGKAFDVFESSGELLQPYMRKKIEQVLRCRVVDRYGLAELGVMAYELNGSQGGLQVFESEGWPEHRKLDDGNELVFTGFRNELMPLIRYATGDRARVVEGSNGFVLSDVIGRIHDAVLINGVAHLTHHIMDILDHRVGGIQDFQIDLRSSKPTLRIVQEPSADAEEIRRRIDRHWPNAFMIEFVTLADMVKVGVRSKFRHVVTA
jgi:phenylacetate-CoA ligase